MQRITIAIFENTLDELPSNMTSFDSHDDLSAFLETQPTLTFMIVEAESK